jgi:hypothetical protein
MEGPSIGLIAAKQDFAGSYRAEIGYYNARNSVINMPLYHYSQLNLHVKNDTIINNIDQIQILLVRHGITEFMTDCKVEKSDILTTLDRFRKTMLFRLPKTTLS